MPFFRRDVVPEVVYDAFNYVFKFIYVCLPASHYYKLLLLIFWCCGWCITFYSNNLYHGFLVSFHQCVLFFVHSVGFSLIFSLCYRVLLLVSCFLFWCFNCPVGMDIPNGDLLAPNFILPRQGLVVNLNQAHVQQQLALFERMIVAMIIDRKNIPVHRLQHIINANWLLLGEVFVRSKHRNFFILEFSDAEDMNFMLANGPWTVQN